MPSMWLKSEKWEAKNQPQAGTNPVRNLRFFSSATGQKQVTSDKNGSRDWMTHSSVIRQDVSELLELYHPHGSPRRLKHPAFMSGPLKDEYSLKNQEPGEESLKNKSLYYAFINLA